MAKVLFDTLKQALAEGRVERKLAMVRDLAAAWQAGLLSLADGDRTDVVPSVVPAPTERGYPNKPALVPPNDVPQRKPTTPEGLAALFHAVVHIEWSAIDLALDHAYRFRGLPAGYYADWIAVAAEEAEHFVLLRDHLRGYGHDYGDFPAHDSLWQLNVRTGHDVLERMALVPRLAEAKGLDATPPIQQKLQKIGDEAGVKILDIILRDEIGHVSLGDKWFRRLCGERGLEPEATYRRLMEQYQAPRPIPPMNVAARRAAGFSESELALLGAAPAKQKGLISSTCTMVFPRPSPSFGKLRTGQASPARGRVPFRVEGEFLQRLSQQVPSPLAGEGQGEGEGECRARGTASQVCSSQTKGPPMSFAISSKLPQVGTTIFTVMSRLAAEHGAINLSQGFPDFSPPRALLERVSSHMAAGHNQYAPMAGVQSLREAIAAKVERLYGRAYHPETEITVTAGATQALATTIAACIGPGDEVIVFAPVYDSYGPAVQLNGGKVVTSTLSFPDYRPDWEEVRALITPRTRMIILNTPHNPTGTLWTAVDMAQLASLVRNTDIVLLADEVYEHMSFDGVRHESIALHPELAERSFVVSSFGKTYHITGWKIAYCLAPAALMAEFRKAHQFQVFCVHHPSQLALADFMNTNPAFADELAAFYQAKRNFFREALAGSRFELLPCAGTYFQLARYQAISDMGDVDFARHLTVDHGVAAIPVSVFYPGEQAGNDHRVVRFCFAKTEQTLAAAAERLCRV